MSNPASRKVSIGRVPEICAAFLTLVALSLLAGCQGVSAGNPQPSPGTISSNPSSLTFGNVSVGHNLSLSAVLSNTGGSSITISQIQFSGNVFTGGGITTPMILGPGTSANLRITFAPTSSGSATGSVTITSTASDAAFTISLSGTGTTTSGQLGVSPATMAIGNVNVGASGTVSGTLTATGAAVIITSATTNNPAFVVSGISAGTTIQAGQSLRFTVKFSPLGAGAATATLTIVSNAQPSTTTETITGTGVTVSGQLGVSPSTMAIGNVYVGASGTGSGTLSATGAAVTISSATTNNSAFVVSEISAGTTIQAGQSLAFTVTFSPLSTGVATATLTVISNAQPSTITETITGTGLTPPTHSVNLSWNASTSPNISGYNIYRAVYTTSCGSFSKINSLLNTGTLYTDSAVTDGTSYCYATTAVDTSNRESGYSNIVSNVQIPPP